MAGACDCLSVGRLVKLGETEEEETGDAEERGGMSLVVADFTSAGDDVTVYMWRCEGVRGLAFCGCSTAGEYTTKQYTCAVRHLGLFFIQVILIIDMFHYNM